jgi:hypothetical protein
MRTCNAKLRYFDWDGQVHLAKGKTGGQQGDPLEMLTFNLTTHHLWGRVLTKFHKARTITFVDDGYIKAKLSVALQVLADLKFDAGLYLNVVKTSILPVHGFTQQAAFDVVYIIIDVSPALMHLREEIALDSVCPKGFVGIGVPIGMDTFVRNFVAKQFRNIIDDVEKLDAIQDGFIRYQLLRFCQATRLQYINSHIMLNNRCVLQ